MKIPIAINQYHLGSREYFLGSIDVNTLETNKLTTMKNGIINFKTKDHSLFKNSENISTGSLISGESAIS